MIPAVGGQPVRLASRGNAPRISPDGKWISFQVGYNLSSIITGNSIGQTLVIPAGGRAARRIRTELRSAANPVWGPDSQHLLVHNRAVDPSGWFLVSTAGDPSRRIGLFEALKRQGFSLRVNHVPQLSECAGDSLFFQLPTATLPTSGAWQCLTTDPRPARPSVSLPEPPLKHRPFCLPAAACSLRA
jgi:hypothetical protein